MFSVLQHTPPSRQSLQPYLRPQRHLVAAPGRHHIFSYSRHCLLLPLPGMPLPLLFAGSAPLSSRGLTLNVLSKKSPSWVSLSKQGLPVSLSPSAVLISFLVLSTVCSHFSLLFTCLSCREGCSLHLPGQLSLFPAGLAGVPGFMRGRPSVAISDPVNQEFEQGGVLGPSVFLCPSTLVWTVPRLPKHL